MDDIATSPDTRTGGIAASGRLLEIEILVNAIGREMANARLAIARIGANAESTDVPEAIAVDVAWMRLVLARLADHQRALAGLLDITLGTSA
jgi:hypothetical protein